MSKTTCTSPALVNQIHGVGPADPLVIGIVITTLGAIALAACALPARRATRLDPIVVLNQQ